MIKKTIALCLLLVTTQASADSGACQRSAAMATEIEEALEHLQEMKALAAQICREKALAKECARQRIEIRAYVAGLQQLGDEQAELARQCAASKR